MKKKYTPGPWKVDNDGDRGYVVESEKIKPIASRIEKVEDARLIGAAPYMFEALEYAAELYDHKGRCVTEKVEFDSQTGHIIEDVACPLCRIKFAIKRATRS